MDGWIVMIGWDIRSDENNYNDNDGIVMMTLIVMISSIYYITSHNMIE